MCQLFVYNQYFFRCSLRSWCEELEKHGTKGASLATFVINVWIHPICAKERAKFIAKLVMAKILDPKDSDLVLELGVCKWPKFHRKILQIFFARHEPNIQAGRRSNEKSLQLLFLRFPFSPLIFQSHHRTTLLNFFSQYVYLFFRISFLILIMLHFYSFWRIFSACQKCKILCW